ncbi:MAG: hypothetical protein LBR67_01335 [Dysgonamonadaceae bacterium]|nr:hypothetical protein [Dysgonamonadaceae bacterium]
MRYLKIISFFVVIMLIMGLGTKEIKYTEGIKPGYLAPKINLQGFSLHDDGYTLIQFWAAYNAQSRWTNVCLSNEISRINNSKLRMVSIAFDARESIFEETIKADKLDSLSQLHDISGTNSEIYKKFQLKKGFYNVLVDSQGVIVARDVQPGEIAELLHL